ncbi:hypothetical protein QM565_22575 [Geitlerinema splendidum]|nr:hypothetical protein [Geitlerinema splendidum]
MTVLIGVSAIQFVLHIERAPAFVPALRRHPGQRDPDPHDRLYLEKRLNLNGSGMLPNPFFCVYKYCRSPCGLRDQPCIISRAALNSLQPGGGAISQHLRQNAPVGTFKLSFRDCHRPFKVCLRLGDVPQPEDTAHRAAHSWTARSENWRSRPSG